MVHLFYFYADETRLLHFYGCVNRFAVDSLAMSTEKSARLASASPPTDGKRRRTA
jgi:hypothetical protein